MSSNTVNLEHKAEADLKQDLQDLSIEEGHQENPEMATDKTEVQSSEGSSDSQTDTDGFTVLKSKTTVRKEKRKAQEEERKAQEAVSLQQATAALKVASVPELGEQSINVNDLSNQERKELLSGPTVAVFVEGNLVRGKVHKRALMAVSRPASLFLKSKPLDTKMVIPTCDRNALGKILDVVETKLHNFRIPLAKNFIEGVKLYQAAKLLEFAPTNTGFQWLKNEISRRLLEYREINELLKRVSPEDPLLTHLAHNLAYLRYKNKIPDADYFDTIYLPQQPVLKDAMQKIDEANSAMRNQRVDQEGSQVVTNNNSPRNATGRNAGARRTRNGRNSPNRPTRNATPTPAVLETTDNATAPLASVSRTPTQQENEKRGWRFEQALQQSLKKPVDSKPQA